MKDNSWLSIASSESKEKRFRFEHQSTANIVSLIIYTDVDNDKPQTIFFEYDEFEELCDFVDHLRTPIKFPKK